MTSKMLIVGSVAIDTIRTPRACRARLLGGSASHAAIAASFFTGVNLVGVVGSDFPRRYLTLFRKHGIDLTGLSIAPGKTFFWEGEYEENMNRRRSLKTELGVFEYFSPTLPESYRACRVALLANIAPKLQLQVLTQLQSPRFVAADTMDLWINTARADLLRLLKRLDLFILNDAEAQQLTEMHNLIAAIKRIHRMGPQYVVVKKGEHGAVLSGPEGMFVTPAYPLGKVVDPTGAGDSFAGAMVGYLIGKNSFTPADLKRAMLYGAAVASFCCEGFGLSRTLRLTKPQIEQRVQEILKLTQI